MSQHLIADNFSSQMFQCLKITGCWAGSVIAPSLLILMCRKGQDFRLCYVLLKELNGGKVGANLYLQFNRAKLQTETEEAIDKLVVILDRGIEGTTLVVELITTPAFTRSPTLSR
jgi:hypothetical protein